MKYSILIVLFVLYSQIIHAQLLNTSPSRGNSIDKVVAIVGDQPILKSDVEGMIINQGMSNPDINIDDPELYDRVLKSMIDNKLLVLKAREDTNITVTDEEVDMRWDIFVQTEIKRYGSRSRVEEVYGSSLPRLKRDLRDLIEEQILAQKLRSVEFANINVTQKEVEKFYQEYKDSLSEVPPQIEIYHIVNNVEKNNKARIEALTEARIVRDSILNGGDFAEFAKRHSDDFQTAKDGGDLGWFERGKLFPEFERAAFDLQVEEISLPVETPFGFHLIQLINKKENSINTRHILFKIEQTENESQIAINELIAIKDSIESGTATFEEMAKRYSDDKDTRGFGGLIGTKTLNEIPPSLQNRVSELEVGEISEPAPYGGDPTNPAFHIIYKKRYINSHVPSLQDDYKYLENLAMEKKRSEKFREFIAELRRELYWELVD